MTGSTFAQDFDWTLRFQKQAAADQPFERQEKKETWKASETAFIVCDVWDYHHCLNAVERLNEFGPRLNKVLTEARQRGALIIHSPSDCMSAYADHPARLRAERTPMARNLPTEVETWCSMIPAEERAVYPIDQSDGGEDDDPQEHARWAESLRALGRNPGMPWKAQNAMISIDSEKDFISDRGDEVWSILEAHGIRNVVLTGVHTNMCVLGRPFGLRQMVRTGRNVVLMRDMTDCMYNPQRWPYVDHFTGNDLVVSHIERFVCPTVTSNQVLGGAPFCFAKDQRTEKDVLEVRAPELTPQLLTQQWNTTAIPCTWANLSPMLEQSQLSNQWYRCTLRIADDWMTDASYLTIKSGSAKVQAWLNGVELQKHKEQPNSSGKSEARQKTVFMIPSASVVTNDANLLVIHTETSSPGTTSIAAPSVKNGKSEIALQGRWQVRLGTDSAWSNMPLPAKFGTGSDIVFDIR